MNFITVRIDDHKCKRCYTCVDECPTGALSLEGVIFCHKAYECSYCESCMMVCQNEAINMMVYQNEAINMMVYQNEAIKILDI